MSSVKVIGIIVLVALASLTVAGFVSAAHTPAVAIEPPKFNPSDGAKTFGVNVTNAGGPTADAIWRVKVTPPAGYTLSATQPAAPTGWTRTAPSAGERPFILFETATARDVSVAIRGDASLTFAISVSAFSAAVSGEGASATWDVETQDANAVPDPVTLEVGEVQTATATSTVDKTAPTFGAFTVPTYANAGSMTVSFTASEALGANPTVTILGRAATRTSGPSPYVYSFNVLAGDANGPATVTIAGADVAGNPATANAGSVTIDTVAPGVWANASCGAGANGWCRVPVVLSAASSDVTSGANAPTCTFSGGGGNGCSRTISADGASYTWQATATDGAGNSATTATTSFKIDGTAPTLTSTRTCSEALVDEWCPGDYTLSTTTSDGGSGGATATCALDGVALASCPTTFATEGAHELRVTSTDNAGNTNTTVHALKVDKTGPSITATAPCALDGLDGWCRGAVTPVVTANDTASATPPAPTCKLDGADVSCSAAISAQGPHTFVATVVDNVGRTASATLTFKIDSIAPTVTATASCASPGPDGWCLGSVNVVTSASDGATALTPTCTLDGAATACTGTVSSDGAHTFVASATDAAGNPASSSTATFKIDRNAPTVTLLSRSPAPNAAGWTTGDITLTFQCTDAGGATSTTTSVVTGEGAALSGTGTCTDGAGRTGSLTVGDLKIDRTAPALRLLSRIPAASAHGWNTGDVSVEWVCTDAISGVASASPTQVVTASGTTVASGACADRAGNTATLTETVRIDRTAPTLEIALGPATPDGLEGWYVRVPTLAITSSDAQSGILLVEHSLDGATFSPGAAPTLREGTYTLTARATDRAGHQTTKSVTVSLDITAPVATLPSGSLTSGRETRILFSEPMDTSVALPVPAGWTGAWSSDGRAWTLQIPAGATGSVTLSVPATTKDAHGLAVAAASSATYTVAPPTPPPSVPPQSGGSFTPPPPASPPPVAPADVRAELDRTSVRVSWSAPSADGGAPLRGYHVLRDGALLATLGLVLDHVDATARPGATYAYSVRAYNDVGPGALSAASSIRVPTPAEAPTVTASLSPAPGEDGVYRTFPLLTLATREGATIHVKIGALSEFVYTEPLALGDGDHDVTFWAEDAAGTSALGILTLRVDTSLAPVDAVDETPAEDPADVEVDAPVEVDVEIPLERTSAPTPDESTPPEKDEGGVAGGQRLAPGAPLAALLAALGALGLALRRRA